MDEASSSTRRVEVDESQASIELPRRILNELYNHALETIPEECCGLIIGGVDDRYRELVRCRNEMTMHHEKDPIAYPRDGREAFFPLIQELVEDPAEVWIGFAKSDASGSVRLRRRYVKLVDLGRDRTLGLVADADNGIWSGTTFFRGTPRGLNALRTGMRVFGR